MDTAKLFKNGRSQAVRLPKEYALPGNEVYVKRVNGIVMLIPKQVALDRNSSSRSNIKSKGKFAYNCAEIPPNAKIKSSQIQ